MQRGEAVFDGRGEECDPNQDTDNSDEKQPAPPPKAKSAESVKGGNNTEKTHQKPKNKRTRESHEVSGHRRQRSPTSNRANGGTTAHDNGGRCQRASGSSTQIGGKASTSSVSKGRGAPQGVRDGAVCLGCCFVSCFASHENSVVSYASARARSSALLDTAGGRLAAYRWAAHARSHGPCAVALGCFAVASAWACGRPAAPRAVARGHYAPVRPSGAFGCRALCAI